MMSRMGEQRTPTAPTYADDFYAWTQHQAKLLRTLLRLDQSLPDDLDLEHVAEEIEDMGKAEVAQVKSLIRQILVHLIKAASEPTSQAAAHWGGEAMAFHADILDRYLPSMRQLIDMQPLWQRARIVAETALAARGVSPADLPKTCPFSVDEIVAPDFRFLQALGPIQPAAKQG
jgi:hypothetical protein